MSRDATEASNSAYLATALHWLRLRLDRLDAIPGTSDEAALSDAAAALAAATSALPAPALPTIGRAFDLTPFEEDVVLLCASMELDPDMPRRCAGSDGRRAPYPTFGLALQLFDHPSWDAFSPSRPLRRDLLIEQPGAAQRPTLAQQIAVDEAMANHIRGLAEVDERLAAVAQVPPRLAAVVIPACLTAVAAEVAALWAEPAVGHPPLVVQLVGANATCRALVAGQAADMHGLQLLKLGAETLAAAPDREVLLRLWRRDCLLLGAGTLIEVENIGPDLTEALERAVAQLTSLIVVLSGETATPLAHCPDVVIQVPWPDANEQKRQWMQVLPPGSEETARHLGNTFRVDPLFIERAAGTVRDGPDLGARVHRRCLQMTRPLVSSAAIWSEPNVGWDDLVLPPEQSCQLRELVARARHCTTVLHDWGFADGTTRGLAAAALFAGPSGTGKTLAAEVIAGELGVPLCRADLSTIVSKYIGETEQNLKRLFDAVERSSAVLFFDEADALFAKRSEVRDSHDRYANFQTSYLLQRLEESEAVVILATNLPDSLDSAFLRRLGLVVTFPFPSTEDRVRMWAQALPERVPRQAQLDLDDLAVLPTTGATIRNIAIRAAFAAADSAAPAKLSRTHVIAAAELELRKHGQRVPERLKR